MTGTATSIECRLLCAAGDSYGINKDTGIYDPTNYPNCAAGVGYTSAPVAVVGGLDGALPIDAALIGKNADGIIVAYRGTIPPAEDASAIFDWIQDIFFSKPCSKPGITGKVHEGFYNAVMAIWPKVQAEVAKLQDASKNTPVYFTGHSKGGPMASISAMLAHGTNGLQPTKVYTYASARAGNADFATAYNGMYDQTSFENYLDIVPFVPPSQEIIALFEKIPKLGKIFKLADGWDYTSVGDRYYIEKSGKVVKDSGLLDILRGGEIVTEIVSGDIKNVAAAHCCHCAAAGCAGGYMRGVCKSEVCP